MVLILTWWDDEMQLVGPYEECNVMEEDLERNFKIKRMGTLNIYAAIEIDIHSPDYITINQHHYLKKLESFP